MLQFGAESYETLSMHVRGAVPRGERVGCAGDPRPDYRRPKQPRLEENYPGTQEDPGGYRAVPGGCADVAAQGWRFLDFPAGVRQVQAGSGQLQRVPGGQQVAG